MTFSIDLTHYIQKGRAEKEQAKAKREDFIRLWTTFHDDIILSVFEEAEALFNQQFGGGVDSRGGRVEPKTNGGAKLIARYLGIEHFLYFSPNDEKSKIICSSSWKKLNEEFTLRYLDRAIVEGKIREFAYLVAREES
jgi:hypothetical protein